MKSLYNISTSNFYPKLKKNSAKKINSNKKVKKNTYICKNKEK